MIHQGWNMPGRLVKVNGFTVHYSEIGSGPPVILLHGLGGSLQDWSENTCVLSRTHRLYDLDLPGFGGSSLPNTSIDYNLGHAADFLRAFADRLGLERVVLIGNSLGGGICLKFAIDYPGRTAGLVKCCGPWKRGSMVNPRPIRSRSRQRRLAVRHQTDNTSCVAVHVCRSRLCHGE
jgi:pimeloyl-ACP methyl ester carboxylesterase